jgi:hypothetical protein
MYKDKKRCRAEPVGESFRKAEGEAKALTWYYCIEKLKKRSPMRRKW